MSIHSTEADDVETIAALHARTQESMSFHQRFAERLTAQLARPRMVYILVVGITSWLGYNALWPNPIDKPPFAGLQTILGIYAAVVTTIVLVVQNRQAKHNQQRAYLDLQVSLLAERKTTKLIGLLEELRRDLPNVRDRSDPQAEQMAEEFDANAVASALESVLDNDNLSASHK